MISVGQTVGNYKVTAKLGEGGMGVVYLAEHPVIGKKVAIKAIHPELSKNPEVISRFMTEAKSVNQIGNEHIVDISDFGNTDDGEFFFVMEFLQGESLADRISREHRFPTERALKIAAQVADALSASHQHGIVHRDLKPENVYLINRGASSDFVKVLDFGLAKLTQGDQKVTHKTRTGSVMGTPYYMSPEQCEGRADVDHRSDIYALGVILFEMLTGKVPFGGEGYGEIIVKHITQPPPSLRAINPMLDDQQEQVVLRALAKNRADRYQNMRDFRAAILDPHAFTHPGPRMTTSFEGIPAARPDEADAISGQVVFGAPNVIGSRARPLPTTFGQGSGELSDEGQVPTQSRRGLFIGVGAAAAAAALGAFLLFGGGHKEATRAPSAGTNEPRGPEQAEQGRNRVDDPAAKDPAEQPTPQPPQKVVVAFRSEPAGAQVKQKASGALLGVTPFDQEVPYSKDPIDFQFVKDGFEPKTLKVVPDAAAKLSIVLERVRTPEAKRPVVANSGRPTKPKVVQPKKEDPSPPAPTRPRRPRSPLDEDAVLEPSFD